MQTRELKEIAETTLRKVYPAAWSQTWANALPEMTMDDLKNEVKRRVREVRAAEWYAVN